MYENIKSAQNVFEMRNFLLTALVRLWYSVITSFQGFYFLRPFFSSGLKIPFIFTREAFRFIGGAEMRVKITLACTECKERNYCSKKNKKNDPDRLEMNKYCKKCRKHTLHKETK